MPGFTLAAAASIAAGLSMGAAATVGVTLLVQGSSVAPGRACQLRRCRAWCSTATAVLATIARRPAARRHHA